MLFISASRFTLLWLVKVVVAELRPQLRNKVPTRSVIIIYSLGRMANRIVFIYTYIKYIPCFRINLYYHSLIEN